MNTTKTSEIPLFRTMPTFLVADEAPTANEVLPGFYRRSFGSIRSHDGSAVSPADALFAVTGTALDMPKDASMYKRWLWSQMKRSEKVVAALYEICNLAYVGVNVHIIGNNARVIADAATYLMKESCG